MTPGLISCIIPVFNGERYLGEALESILAQSYQPLEVIVVDDGSTDGTAEVARRYGEQVRYVWQPNAGETAARNRGVIAAQGEFMAFLDADDVWHAEKLERQIGRFQERPEIDLCFSQFQHFWMPELAEEEKRYQGHPLSQPLAAYSIGTLLVRRSVFEVYGMFRDDGLGGPVNLVWFLGAAKQGANIEILSNVLMYRRLHGNNETKAHMKRGKYFEVVLLPIVKAWLDYQRQRLKG